MTESTLWPRARRFLRSLAEALVADPLPSWEAELTRLREENARQAEAIRVYKTGIQDHWIPLEAETTRLRAALSLRDATISELRDELDVARTVRDETHIWTNTDWKARAEQARADVARMRELIDSYSPGSDFVTSGAAHIFRATLNGTLGQEANRG